MIALGIFYLILTFVFCFTIVHVVKLAYLGFLSLKKKDEPQKPALEKTEKPVYYIVEKKRQRRASYSAPREIEFK